MPFFPIFNILDNQGFIHLSNFSPNSWEKISPSDKILSSFHTNGNLWEVNCLGKLSQDHFKCFQSTDFVSINSNIINDVTVQELVLIDLREDNLEDRLMELPKKILPSTTWPEWRATIGVKNSSSRVSYQGEILPFPPQASLLTFHPFIQFEDINNYFVFLNIESSPIHRWSEVEIYLSSTGKKIDTKIIRNNAANVFSLDQYEFTPEDLPVFYCKNMAGIPFGFGKSRTTGMLSLEHTHPPGSLTLHGNRMKAQRDIKLGWVNHLEIH